MLTAQQLTELGELKGTNEACLMGKEDRGSMAATLPDTTGVGSAKKAFKAVAKDFGQLKDGTLLWH